MTPTIVVMLITAASTCATAFLIAYWHRKQLRQNELFRKDSSVGIQPPPSALVSFLRRYLFMIVGVGVPLCSIILVLVSWPLTKTMLVVVGYNIALMLLNVQFLIEFRLLGLFGRVMDAHDAMDGEMAALRQRVGALESSPTESHVLGSKRTEETTGANGGLT